MKLFYLGLMAIAVILVLISISINNVEGFDYESSAEVYDEAMNTIGKIKGDNIDKWGKTVSSGPKRKGLQRITETPMNMVDSLTRHAESLRRQSCRVSSPAIAAVSHRAIRKPTPTHGRPPVRRFCRLSQR